MISDGRRISGKAQNLPDPEGGHSDDVRLEGQAVPVPQRELNNRIDPDGLEMEAHGEGAHPHHGSLVVGDVHGVDPALEWQDLPEEFAGLRSFGGRTFGGDQESSFCQGLAEGQGILLGLLCESGMGAIGIDGVVEQGCDGHGSDPARNRRDCSRHLPGLFKEDISLKFAIGSA